VVVGGGDSAMEEALYLTKFASKVTLVHRRADFRASQIMVDRVKAHGQIEILTPFVVEEALGADTGKLTGVLLRNVETDETLEYPTDGLFVAIGHDPTTKLFVDWLDHDENGYLVTQGKSTDTNIPGVFAAGDVQDHVYRQAITAAGSGCAAALDAERFLAESEGHPEAALTAPREHSQPA
jgi:thioredoxin reductase (NADPH)